MGSDGTGVKSADVAEGATGIGTTAAGVTEAVPREVGGNKTGAGTEVAGKEGVITGKEGSGRLSDANRGDSDIGG
jgi:hypothetical protein